MKEGIWCSADETIEPESVRRLFEQTDWAKGRRLEDIVTMLEQSYLTVGVWREDRLVGFGRVVSDGVFRALVDDIVVDEAERGRGHGRLILEAIRERTAHIEACFLCTGPNLERFYNQFGFKRSEGFHMNRA